MKTVTVGLPKWSQRHFESSKKFHCIVAHRKARKTTAAVAYLSYRASLEPGSYWYIVQTFGLAKENIWQNPQMLFAMFDESEIISKNSSDLMVRIAAKGGFSDIYFKGADRPDLMRGPSPRGVILDEYSILKPEVWEEIVAPIIYAVGGWVWFLGTPKGKNHFYKLYEDAKTNTEKWELTYLPASQSGMLLTEALEDARKTMRGDAFLQEFECAWLEGASQFFRNVDNIFGGNLISSPVAGRSYIAGIDLGRIKDSTVIKIFDKESRKQVFSDSFTGVTWGLQKQRLVETLKKWDCWALTDSTSLGGKIILDELQGEYSKVEGFDFTQKSKPNLLEKLAVFIEQNYISLAGEDETLKTQLKSFEYSVQDSGLVRIGTQNEHDDHVIATALAVWQLDSPRKEEPVRELTYEEMRREETADAIRRMNSGDRGQEFREDYGGF